MLAKIRKSSLTGEVWIPGSKSHMIRALYFGALGKGESIIRKPVRSKDSLSAAGLVKAMGVSLNMESDDLWTIGGGELSVPDNVVDVGNSGTSLYIGTALAASLDGRTVFTGDEQIRNRPALPVLSAMEQLGAEAFAVRDNGRAPFIVRGPLKGGVCRVDGISSQFVSSSLLAASLAEGDSEIHVDEPKEIPYIEMTLQWMKNLGVSVEASEDFKRYLVKAGQRYSSFDRAVPADFSSASFMLVGAAITESDLTLNGLDTRDVQGDKVLIEILKSMGADIEVIDFGAGGIRVRGGNPLKGCSIDCAAIPDSLPILSILGCAAEGETRLFNIESARIKETDRPLMMAKELSKMGADIELTDRELIIRKSRLRGCDLKSYGDHRLAMSFSVAGLTVAGETVVDGMETASISYPGFISSLTELGAEVLIEGEEL